MAFFPSATGLAAASASTPHIVKVRDLSSSDACVPTCFPDLDEVALPPTSASDDASSTSAGEHAWTSWRSSGGEDDDDHEDDHDDSVSLQGTIGGFSAPGSATTSAGSVHSDESPKKAGASGLDWRLVWTHERCFKAEEDTLRNMVDSSVSELGGALISFKKAKTFEAWAKRAPRSDYVLLTDAREVKPCVKALLSSPESPTLLIVVLAENFRSFARVRAWVKTLRSQGITIEIRVIRSCNELKPILANVLPSACSSKTSGPCSSSEYSSMSVKQDRAPPALSNAQKALTEMVEKRRANGAASTMPMYSSPDRLVHTSQGMAMPPMACTTPQAAAPMHFVPVAPAPVAWQAVMVQQPAQQCYSVACGGPNTGLPPTRSFFLEKSSQGVTPAVLQVLADTLPKEADATGVEQILVNSLPEIYEE